MTRTFNSADDLENFVDGYKTRWYENVVQSLVKDVKDEALSKYIEDDFLDVDVNDVIHTTVENSQYIIYCGNHYDILAKTQNREAYFEMGDGSADDDNIIEQMAFFALRQDVTDEIGNWVPEDENFSCPNCGLEGNLQEQKEGGENGDHNQEQECLAFLREIGLEKYFHRVSDIPDTAEPIDEDELEDDNCPIDESCVLMRGHEGHCKDCQGDDLTQSLRSECYRFCVLFQGHQGKCVDAKGNEIG